jgi:hypothetical protein
MEQRNGRIDRKLQQNPAVYCHYFFYTQRPEDKSLAALVRKTKTIREELGSLSKVIDSKLDLLMTYGIRRRDVEALTSEIESTNMDQESRGEHVRIDADRSSNQLRFEPINREAMA